MLIMRSFVVTAHGHETLEQQFNRMQNKQILQIYHFFRVTQKAYEWLTYLHKIPLISPVHSGDNIKFKINVKKTKNCSHRRQCWNFQEAQFTGSTGALTVALITQCSTWHSPDCDNTRGARPPPPASDIIGTIDLSIIFVSLACKISTHRLNCKDTKTFTSQVVVLVPHKFLQHTVDSNKACPYLGTALEGARFVCEDAMKIPTFFCVSTLKCL